jgi:enediyne biosynthesis protein E4
MRCSSCSSTTGSREPTRPSRTLSILAGVLAVAPLAAQATVPPKFKDVTKDSRLWFKHQFGGKQLENLLMTTGSGCALFDFDNDGWLDAFLVNGTHLDAKGLPAADKQTHHALFRNKRDGTFENVTKASGITAVSYGQGCACGDFDGDGHTDLYITNYGKNLLYRNRGDGTFEDVTAKSGTGDQRWGGGAVFFDYDGDGDLDLYVANYVKYKPGMKGVHASSHSKRKGFRFFPGPRDYEAEDDVLFRNDGDGKFVDVSKAVGLAEGGKGMTVVACDLDGDGDQDVFVANDATENFLYRNDGGKFVEVALEAGVAYDPDGAETAAMGVDIADANSDGRPDLYVTNMIFEFNNMYLNQGNMEFKDKTRSIGLDKDNYRHVGWATRFADFNHDGYLDCFVANGHVVDYVEGFSQSITYPQQNLLFVGDAKGNYRNVANSSGACFTKKRVSRGGAFGDYDNDGDIDILVANSGSRARLLRNELPRNDRWLKIRLRGKSPNTHAIGAKVQLRIGERSVRTEVRFSSSYLSSSDPTLHFGLGMKAKQGTVEVRWPDGRRSKHGVKAGTLIVIDEPSGAEKGQKSGAIK